MNEETILNKLLDNHREPEYDKKFTQGLIQRLELEPIEVTERNYFTWLKPVGVLLAGFLILLSNPSNEENTSIDQLLVSSTSDTTDTDYTSEILGYNLYN